MNNTTDILPETSGAESPLSPEQVTTFQEQGFLVIDFGFDGNLLDRIREKVQACYPEEYRVDSAAPVRVQDAWQQVDEVRQLAVDRRVLAALKQLYGRRALPFQTLNFPVATRQRAHSDTIHFNSIPSGYMAGVWIALEDMDEENGPLIYYPGSHKLPEYNMQDLNLGTSHEFYPQYEQAIQKLIAEHGLQPEYGTIRKGEALIWQANLLHGGAPQKDPSRSRHSQVTHYYFEGCKYYTPMNSTAEAIQFRDPIFIPEAAEDVPRVMKELHPGLIRRLLRRLGLR